jgi:hypothetical protein
MQRRRTLTIACSVAVTAALTLGACGRSDSKDKPSGPSAAATPATPSVSAAGDFGSLKAICKDGTPKPVTGRGITDTSIRIGVMADPGAAAAPGLEQEFFDAADGFSKWCNAAGGINGRKIVIDKLDSKLFEVAARMIDACQKDFMLVGGGNTLDSAGVKQRLNCKLGQIPGYVVSPEAVSAGLQVQATPSNSRQYPIGSLRLLADAYPDAKTKGIGIGSSNLASIRPQGRRAEEALQKLGIKVTVVQERPPLVDNYRPYMEELKGAGTVGYSEIGGQDPAAEIQAINNVGWKPQFVLYGVQYYSPKSVQSVKTLTFPPSYVWMQHLPFELTADFPVLQQIRKIMDASGVADVKYDDYTALAFNAWTLWAQSATACEDNLSQDCILSKAADHKDWTAGGLFPPRDTDPANPQVSQCIVLLRLTSTGFVYDKAVTAPNSSVYNCDPLNVGAVQTHE